MSVYSEECDVSELVYDTSAAGSYLEAVVSSLGISNDQLVMNVAERLREQIFKTNTIPWPPYIHELEREEDLCELLLKLTTCLKHPNRSTVDDDSSVRFASVLTLSLIHI